MVLPCTSTPSEMHCSSDTDGNHNISTHSLCVWQYKFDVEHALSCPRGGFPSIHHNEIQDNTANLNMMSEACHAVGTETCLQPETGKNLTHRTANREERARLNIVVQSFWGRGRQSAIFDVRVFNPYAQLHPAPELSKE